MVYRLEEPFEMNQEEFQKAEVGSGWGRMVMLMEGCVLGVTCWVVATQILENFHPENGER